MNYLKLRLTSTTPLLMANPITVNPFAPETQAIKAASAKRKRTEAEELDLYALKFKAGLYIDDTGPFLPGYNIFKSGQEAARLSKDGKIWERGVKVRETKCYLKYDGPRDARGLWGNGISSPYVDVRDGRVASGSRIPVVRPMFPNWETDITFDLIDTVADGAKVLANMVDGGTLIGVGTFRARFGKFKVSLVDSSVKGIERAAENLGVEIA